MKNALHVVLAGALFTMACGGDEGQVAAVVDTQPDRPETEVPTPEPEGLAYLIEAADPLPLEGNALSATTIRAILRDAQTREVVAEQMLGFEIVVAPDTFTSLSASTDLTDADGIATVNLRLGPDSGRAVVRVSHADAESIDIDVNVGDPLGGVLRVDVVNPTTTLDISPYRISVFDMSDFGCNNFEPRTRLDTAQQQVHTPDTSPVDIGGLAGGEYTVVAEALGSGGLVLAGGCVDFVDVTNGMTTAVTVPLELYPISPSGTYEVNGEWDISAAVSASNSTAGTLVGVIEFMANPGQSIYTLVIDELEDAIDNSIPIGMLLGLTGVEQQIVQTINDALFQFAPIQVFSAVANDLNNMLHHLQVTSILTIAKTDNDFAFHGHEEWKTLTVDWTWRCQQNPTQSCQQYTVDLQSAAAAAATVEYEWEGYVDGYNKLVVGSHNVHFDVGRLQTYLLEQVIIPDLTGGNATSLSGALAYWVDCAGLAQQALGNNDVCDPSGTFCLGATLIEGACVAAMTAVADAVLGPIQGQDVIADMTLDGKATLVDVVANGLADELHDGVTEGVLTNSTEPVTATWTGVRIADPTAQP